MSDRKLTFSEFIDKEFDDVDVYCGVNKLSHYDISKISWNFAEAQEKREYDLLEAEHSELLANFCKVDIERIKLSREVEELKKKVEELEERDINRLFHKAMTEVVGLRKKLSEAVECIEKMCFDDCAIDLSAESRSILIDVIKYHDREARDFLKGNKDEFRDDEGI